MIHINRKKVFSCLFAFLCAVSVCFSETEENAEDTASSEQSAAVQDTSAKSGKLVKPKKPYDPGDPYLLHNWGVSWSRVTRIQTKTDRSNFVWQDDFIGLYYALQTGNLPVNFLLSAEVQYPYHYEFNKVEQLSKQIILYSFNFNLGPIWTKPMFDFFKLDLAPMVHFRYQLSDKYHHCDLGIGAFAGVEFPVMRKFSVLLNAEFTYDFGNLGSNANVQPFNHVFSYNVQLGFRLSNRGANTFYYINDPNAKERRAANAENRQNEREQRLKEREEEKQRKAEAKEQYKKELQEYKEAKKSRGK